MVHLVERNKIGKWVYVDDSLDFRKMHDLKFDYHGNMFGKIYGSRSDYCIPGAEDPLYQKDWIPYEGPNGGKGWQNTEDSTDIRYTEEPPGQVASENTSDDELSPSEITDASEIKADDIKFDTEDTGHEIRYSFHAMNSEIQFDMGIPKDGDSAMAYHMWIDESQRGKGVATELMVAAEQEAKENGIKNLNATIGGDSEATQAFFESLGYKQGVIDDGKLVQPEGEWAYYHKPLESESGDSEEVSKSWRAYQGPRGGEGWQNTDDPTDIRYQQDAPGPVEALQEYDSLSDIPKPKNREETEQYIRIIKQDETWRKGEEAFEKSFREGDNTKNRFSTTRETGDGDEVIEWDEDRVREIHDPAVEDVLNEDAASDEPIAVILLGPAGAGKGWWEEQAESGAYGEGFDREFTRINSDDTKEYIPEYEGTNSAEVHKEASHLAKSRVFPEAVENNHNIMYDTVANNPEATLDMIETMQSADYDLRAVFVDTPPQNSITQVVSRFEEGGRMVPLDYAYQTTTSSRESFEEIIEFVDDEKVGVFVNDEFGEAPRVEVQGEDVFKYLAFVYGDSKSLYGKPT